MARPPIDALVAASADDLGMTDAPVVRTAVTLVAAVHATRDRDTWGGLKYWDQLAARVLLGTYRAETLPGWWEQMCRQMGCGQPGLAADRQVLAAALGAGDDAGVLAVLATETDTLCLRVRLAWEHHYGPRDATVAPEGEPA